MVPFPMKPKVVLYHPVPQDVIDLLESHFELTHFPKVDAENKLSFLAAVSEAHGIIGMGLPVSTLELKPAKHLKVITTISAGYDSFDVSELNHQGVLLMNLFDPLTETTADLAFALLMASARRIVELDGWMRQGQWERAVSKQQFGVDIHGKTLGIVGLGRIGAAIARRGALGCGMKVLYTARTPKVDAENQLGARRCSLNELLSESDFVVVAVPLSAETTHLIGKNEFSLMKKTAIIVNIARGAVIDENAMIEALQQGTIHGAGLDVFETEPLPASSPLIGMQNVVLAPHIGSATEETRDAMSRYAAESLIDFLVHNKVRNPVNPEVLQSP